MGPRMLRSRNVFFSIFGSKHYLHTNVSLALDQGHVQYVIEAIFFKFYKMKFSLVELQLPRTRLQFMQLIDVTNVGSVDVSSISNGN